MILDGSTTYTHKFCKLLHNHCDFLPFLFGELGINFYLCTQQIKERAPAFGADTHFCLRANNICSRQIKSTSLNKNHLHLCDNCFRNLNF